MRQLPAQVTSIPVALGGKPDGVVVTLGLGSPVAEALVQAADALQLRRGQAGVLVSARGSRIAVEVMTVGKSAVDKSGRAVARVRLRPAILTLQVGGRYTFQVVLRASGPNDLVVPVTALWAAGADKTKVTVLTGSHGRDVEVSVIVSLDGEVAIRPTAGGSIAAGDRVVVGQRGEVPN